MHITVILAAMPKSAILIPKNLICPILPQNKITYKYQNGKTILAGAGIDIPVYISGSFRLDRLISVSLCGPITKP
jgi:hypothetical protein